MNKVALITGGTSGIGRATALVLAEHGYQLMVSGRSEAGAAETVSAIAAAGGHASSRLGDVSDPAFADHLVAETTGEFGRIDVCVNAAGVIVRADGPGTTDEQWRTQMAVNVDGTFFVSRAAVRAMQDQGTGGAIVNVASTAGLVGSAGLAGYCASKAAVVGLTKAMALDHAAEGIRVNCVCPGAVDTPMLRSGREAAPMADKEIFDMNLASIPQGRVPDAAEVGALIAFLASDRAAHIVGAAIPIDGGYVAQ